jgi:hypothetical protein
MKRYVRKSLAPLLMTLLVFWTGACNFEETNINPNATTSASINVILPVASTNLVWAINDFSAQSASTFVQYMTGVLNVQFNITVYQYLPPNFNTTWNNHFYAGALKDLKTITELATEQGSTHYAGIAKIQTAMALGYLVDLWDDVPWSQALDLDNNERPAFDPGAQVYEEVFRLLDAGIADLNSNSSFSPARDDLIFPATTQVAWRANSLPRWIKTANALKARMHNHLSKVNPQGSATAALQAIDAGTFVNNAEELKVVFGSTNDAAGPWFGFFLGTFGLNNIGICQTFIDLLKDRIEPGVHDPRLRFFVQERNGDFIGTPVGATTLVANASPVGPYINAPNAPTNIVTYAEVKFIEAEASFRLGQFERAAQAYNDAVKASLLRVTGTAQPAYEAIYASETAASIQDNGLQKIFTEKHIALFLQTESWTDWRRSIPANAPGTTSGIPTLAPPSNNGTNGVFPRRFLYPQTEFDNNGANVPVKLLTDKVFWDL